MTDDEMVRQIAHQCAVAVFLSLMGRKAKAQLFINHVLRVTAANKDAVERWMKARQLPEARHIGKTLDGERYTVPE